MRSTTLPRVDRRLLWPLAVSIVYATAFFVFWPTNQINDDGAIALRYMDNFAKGYFFTYNISDGPVFGLSGFVHGAFAGAIAYSHLLTPLNSLFASNFLGLALTMLFSIRILQRAFNADVIAIVAAVILLTASRSFITSAKMGLETPLHLAIILAAFWAWARGYALVWALLVLCVISKLDATPIVVVIGLMVIVERLAISRTAPLKSLAKEVCAFGILPLLAWLLFASWYFGSPLPQSAYSKLYVLGHPASRFAFVDKLLYLWPILLAIGLAVSLQWITARRAGWFARVKDLTYLAAAVGVVVLYIVFNPNERYSWYYAVPEFLIILQLFVSTGTVIKTEQRAHARLGVFVPIALLIVSVCHVRVYSSIRDIAKYIAVVDMERVSVGVWVRENGSPKDSILTGHGHIAEQAGMYSLDYNGLNTRQSTELGNDKRLLLLRYRPRWFVQSGLEEDPGVPPEGYVLRKSFYDISDVGAQKAWRVFELVNKVPRLRYMPVSREAILSNGSIRPSEAGQGLRVEASVVEIMFPDAGTVRRFRTGIVLGRAGARPECWINLRNGGFAERAEGTVEYGKSEWDVQNYSGEMSVEFGSSPRLKSIVIRCLGTPTRRAGPFRLIEPVIEYGLDE